MTGPWKANSAKYKQAVDYKGSVLIIDTGGFHFMASKHFAISTLARGILAIIAGVICIIWPGMAIWVLGIFLIVWGVLTLIDR